MSEFNLLDEPWIPVCDLDGNVQNVSLKGFYRGINKWDSLAGDSISQNFVMMRFLLSPLYSVFARADIHGNPSPVDSYNSAIERWQSLYQLGYFPYEPIEQYLEKYRYRFYLFDDKYPFFQNAGISGTYYTAAKLNGNILQSGNKPRFGIQCSNENAFRLNKDEAARWLIWTQAYDDTSVKHQDKTNHNSVHAGWCGQIGGYQVVGKNLFDTMMRNFVLLKDGEEVFGEERPVWEREPENEERRIVAAPDNLSELYTFQDRRILLQLEGEYVTGFIEMGGDSFDPENAFIEPMTAWRRKRDKKGKSTDCYVPKRHSKEEMAWQDFSVISGSSDTGKMPGIIAWERTLQEEGVLPMDDVVQLMGVAVHYVDKFFSVDDMFYTQLSFPGQIVTKNGRIAADIISDEIRQVEHISYALKDFGRDLTKAEGGDNEKRSQRLQEEFFRDMDKIFTQWFRAINQASAANDLQRLEELFQPRPCLGIKEARALAEKEVKKSCPSAYIRMNFSPRLWG